MADYQQGFEGTALAGIEARNDITVCVRNWYANLNPMVTRLANIPVDRVDFDIYTHPYRAGSTTLTTAISATTTTGLVVGDTSFIMNHDVLELVDSVSGASEYVWVNGDPPSSTTVTVVRAVASTTATATVTAASTINLIGNSRTGDEIDQSALTTLGTKRSQYCQTFEHPVAVGGSAQTTRAAVLPGGIQSPFDFNKTLALQNLVNDMERTMYYGKSQAPVDGASAVSAKMAGLKSILTTNKVTSPTNASAYGSSDLIRDTLQAARQAGGDPDLLFVSTNFMGGFATWGHAVQRLTAGATVFGTPIKILKAPFLDDVTIIEAPLLRAYTAFCINTAEVYTRYKRQIFWNMRGNRGDRVEGDWITEMALQVENEPHHAWVEGITAFSAT